MKPSKQIMLGSILIFSLVALYFLVMDKRIDFSPGVIKKLRLESGTLLPEAKVIGAFELLNQEQMIFSQQQLQNKWHLFFMGFTHCPHICPTEMQVLKMLYEKLPEHQRRQLQITFVTTDPLRDTPAVIEKYLKGYHQDFIGLTGSNAQIARFAKQFAMPFIPSQEKDKNSDYEVNHSAAFYLTDPNGRLAAIFSAPHDVRALSQDLLKLL